MPTRTAARQLRFELLTNRDIRNVFMEIRPLTLKFLRIRDPRKTNYALLLERRQQLAKEKLVVYEEKVELEGDAP